MSGLWPRRNKGKVQFRLSFGDAGSSRHKQRERKGEFYMAKSKHREGRIDSPSSLKVEVDKAVGEGGKPFVRIREDGAVCFGDECVVIKRNEETGELDLTVKPDKCGAIAGEAILDHIVRTAGKGVHIHIPAIEEPK
jgi:hypothetical protein